MPATLQAPSSRPDASQIQTDAEALFGTFYQKLGFRVFVFDARFTAVDNEEIDPGPHPANMTKPETIAAWRQNRIDAIKADPAAMLFVGTPDVQVYAIPEGSSDSQVPVIDDPFVGLAFLARCLEDGAVVLGYGGPDRLQAWAAYCLRMGYDAPLEAWRQPAREYGGHIVVSDPLDFMLRSNRTAGERQAFARYTGLTGEGEAIAEIAKFIERFGLAPTFYQWVRDAQ